MNNLFTKHPKNVGESYLTHFIKALSFSYRLFVLSLKVFIHSIFPFIYKDAASMRIKQINDDMQKRKNKSL